MVADMKEFGIIIFHNENSGEQRKIVAKEILSFNGMMEGSDQAM